MENEEKDSTTNCYYCGRDMESPVPCGPTERGACPCCGLTIVTEQAVPFGAQDDEE